MTVPPIPEATNPEPTAPDEAAATVRAGNPPVLPVPPAPAEARCANCGASLPADPPPAYCPQCGQEARLHPPTAGEFLHEFVGHYFALEGALWRTLKLLFLKPGQLTREYLEGRRRRYVLPLRLYISASFLFFIVVKLMGAGTGPFINLEIDAAAADPASRAALQACAQGGDCNRFERWASARVLQAQARGIDNRRVQAALLSMAPYAVFAMQPVFAGLVGLAYRRRQVPYGAHFVFSLHLHSLWFVGLLAIALLPEDVGSLLLLPMALYAALALHRVYGGRPGPTLLRVASISVAYLILLLLAMLGMAVMALSTA